MGDYIRVEIIDSKVIEQRIGNYNILINSKFKIKFKTK